MKSKISLGKVRLSEEAGAEHYLFLGATGSGKTTFVKMLMQSTLCEPSDFPPRAFVYDPKHEALPVLGGLGRLNDCLILNPLDQRCAAWDLAKDINDPISARQLATILTSSQAESENGRFFKNAVCDILTAVTLTLINASNEGSWTFRDLILGVLYPSYLNYLLHVRKGRNDRDLTMNQRVHDIYFRLADERTTANIRASLLAEIGKYEPIAAVWAYVMQRPEGPFRNRFSLLEWASSGDVLVLGNDESARASIDPINQAIFQRASELLLNGPSKPWFGRAGRTWIYLDEVREAGRLPILSRLLNKGRAHGVTTVLSFQDVEGLRAEYGPSVANEVIAQCGNKVIFKLDSPESAQWASAAFGEFVAPEESISNSFSKEVSHSQSFSRAQRRNLETSNFLFLPKAGVENGIHAYYKHADQTPESMYLYEHAEWKRDIAPQLPEEIEIAGFERHQSTEVFYLNPWTQKDWDRLGFSGYPPSVAYGE